MASINPSGNFIPKNLSGTGARNRQTEGDEGGLNIQDGLTLSGPVSPEKANFKLDLPNLPVQTPEDPQAWYDPETQSLNFRATPDSQQPNQHILMYEMGAIGGSLLHATQPIDAPKDGPGVSEFAFTNGLNSTSLMGLSGQTLADLNPLK